MQRKNLVKLLTAFLLLITFSVNAFEGDKHQGEHQEKDTKTEIKEFIQHHLKDSHDFSITSYTDKETGTQIVHAIAKGKGGKVAILIDAAEEKGEI